MQASCGFGHIYDSDLYTSCPYCRRSTRAIYFDAGNTANAVPSGGQSDTLKTVAWVDYGGQRNHDIAPTEKMEYTKEKNIGVFKQKYGIDPVVAWLVCVDGPEMGQDYRLYNRINTIGRAEDNDVVLLSEQTISQRNHASIAYYEKYNVFYIIPGRSRNISFLNGKPLDTPQMLQPYDEIEFGETKLLFLPLCTERFRWKQRGNG